MTEQEIITSTSDDSTNLSTRFGECTPLERKGHILLDCFIPLQFRQSDLNIGRLIQSDDYAILGI